MEKNEQEPLARALLVPPQQSSGLGTLDLKHDKHVESMTNVENTRSREVIPNSLMLIVSKLDDMLVKKWKQGSFNLFLI